MRFQLVLMLFYLQKTDESQAKFLNLIDLLIADTANVIDLLVKNEQNRFL